MTVSHSGRIMVRVPRAHFNALSAGRGFRAQRFEPLFTSSHDAGILPGSHLALDRQTDWLLHEADHSSENPWDVAHKVARGTAPGSAGLAASHGIYAEPDIRHERNFPKPKHALALAVQPADKAAPYLPAESLNTHFEPREEDFFSPAWHLGADYTNFIEAWKSSKGKGIRIAHLDTGYAPDQYSKPRGLLPEQGYNYPEKNTNTIDPGSARPWEMPGHGTATLALLAGGAVNIQYRRGAKWPVYKGDIGGAPDATVIPVRIGASVIHLYTADLARGLDHALAPRGGPPCDVVSLSHGGLPSTVWAAAVNRLYEAGIVIVAAAGDSFNLKLLDVATHFTVYPSAFYRVITATGATYAKGPYKTSDFGAMQGCWGPEKVMKKAVAAYTPNVPWMDFKSEHGWDMDGGGTSASTPQIAAACALWLAQYKDKVPLQWRRVEACRHALFLSLKERGKDTEYIGGGILDAGQMLSAATFAKVQKAIQSDKLPFVEPDRVSFPFWRLLFGLPPPGAGVDEMYETEAAQLFHRSKNKEFAEAVAQNLNLKKAGPARRKKLRNAFLKEPAMSRTLHAYLSARAAEL